VIDEVTSVLELMNENLPRKSSLPGSSSYTSTLTAVSSVMMNYRHTYTTKTASCMIIRL